MNAIAPPTSSTAQPRVSSLPVRRTLASSRRRPFSGAQKSKAAAEASEFIDDDSDDIAAAKTHAISSPVTPAGKLLHDEPGEDLVVSLERPALVEGPQADSHQQEQGELDDHGDSAPDESLLRVAAGPAREQALHYQLVRAVGRHREDRPAHQSGQQGVGSVQTQAEVEDAELARLARRREHVAPPARNGGLDGDNRDERSQQIEHQLDRVDPHHGPDPAPVGVDERQGGDHGDRHGVGPVRNQRQGNRGGEQP